MTLMQLINTNYFYLVQAYLFHLYPSERAHAYEYAKIYHELSFLDQIESNLVIHVLDEKESRDHFDQKVVGIHLNEGLKDYDYGLSYYRWNKVIASEITQKSAEKYLDLEIIAHALYQMTRHGLAEEIIQNSLLDLYSTEKDAEGNEYRTIQIGNQIWLAENLRTTRFMNRDRITSVTSSADWEVMNRQHLPACSPYMFDYENIRKFGLQYNWYAIADPRELLPEGWHVPDDKDWGELIKFLGGQQQAGRMLRALNSRDMSYGRTSSGFRGLPGGSYMDYTFSGMESVGYWWSRTEGRPLKAKYCRLSHYGSEVLAGFIGKSSALSVRLVKSLSSGNNDSDESTELP
jgi:uncharacterized protein (TIGR02145 family)